MITVLAHSRLLDSVGDEPEENMSVVVEQGEIKDIYSGEKPVPGETTIINLDGITILPGLSDAHIHPAYTAHGLNIYTTPTIRNALKIIEQLSLDLQAGFTTICDKHGGNWALKQAVEEGLIKGPRILISCSAISKTGGHGDYSNYRSSLGDPPPKDTGLIALQRLADGVDDCRKAAREQLRNGADQLKIRATGGAGSPNDELTDVAYSEMEIQAMVEEAEDNGKYVAAHCENIAGIKRAIKCGVRSIDHGFGFDEEAALQLKEKGFFHVPTLIIIRLLVERGSEMGVPDYFIRKATVLFDEAMRSTELTHRLKCNVASGSDLGHRWHGMQGGELKLKTECGMSAYEAIKSATIVNARLFRMEDKIGTIEIGKWADIIAVTGNPDEDIELLGNPSNVRLVMKGGQIMKNTLFC